MLISILPTETWTQQKYLYRRLNIYGPPVHFQVSHLTQYSWCVLGLVAGVRLWLRVLWALLLMRSLSPPVSVGGMAYPHLYHTLWALRPQDFVFPSWTAKQSVFLLFHIPWCVYPTLLSTAFWLRRNSNVACFTHKPHLHWPTMKGEQNSGVAVEDHLRIRLNKHFWTIYNALKQGSCGDGWLAAFWTTTLLLILLNKTTVAALKHTVGSHEHHVAWGTYLSDPPQVKVNQICYCRLLLCSLYLLGGLNM